MFIENKYVLQSHDTFFTSQIACHQFATPLKKRLMDTRPSPNSGVQYYCFEVPKEV
jgi:hypothetical protein